MRLVLGVYFVLMLSECHCGTWDPYCISKVANRTIQNLGWTKTAVLLDNDNGDILPAIEHLELMIYDMTIISETNLHEIYEQLSPDVNVIAVINSSRFLKKVIQKADEFDRKMNYSTDWTHHSKWLLFSSDMSITEDEGLKVKNLQNIGVLTRNIGQCECSVDTFSLHDNRFQQMDDSRPLMLRLFPNTQYGYNRHPLRVSAVESPPFVISKPKSIRDGIPYTGYNIDVLRTIAEYLNFTLQYVEPRNGIWGWIDDGMMGQLRRREIDMVASEMTVHVARAQHMDYITPYLVTDQLVLLYRMPPATEPILLLALPFQLSVYLAYVAVTFAVIIILIFFQSFFTFTNKTPMRGVWHVCGIVIKSSLKQGASLNSILPPGRIILTFWWFFVMLVSALYCGNLTAFMAANTSLRKFRSLDELLNSDFSVGVIPGNIIQQMLKNSTHTDVQRLDRKIRRLSVEDPGVISSRYDYHIQRVLQGKYAYVTYSFSAEKPLKNNCNLSRLYSKYMTQDPMTFVVQKNSPFKEDISKTVHLLNSRGILKKLWHKWNNHTRAGDCGGRKGNVVMMDLIGGVIVAGAGIGLAILCLVLEHSFTLLRKA